MGSSDESPPIEVLLAETGWVARLARSLVSDPNAADDLVQETWLRVLKSPPNHAGNVRSWLARVVRNAARERGRNESSRKHREERVEHNAPAPSAQDLAIRAEEGQRLTGIVLALPETYRTVLLMRYFQGLSLEATAEQLGIPASTARTRMGRALGLMRDRLESEETPESPWRMALLPLAMLAPPRAVGPAFLRTTGIGVGSAKVAAAAIVGLAGLGVWLSGEAPRAESEMVPAEGFRSGPRIAADGAEVAGAPVQAVERAGEVRDDAQPMREALARVVRVQSPEGAAIADARVYVISGDELVLQTSSDDSGNVALTSEGDTWAAWAPGYLLDWGPLDPESDRFVLQYAGSVSGTLRMDTGELESPVAVQLESDAEASFVLPAELRAIGDAEALRSEETSFTDADGTFGFHGLPADWTGTLRIPGRFAVRTTTAGALQRARKGSRELAQTLWFGEPVAGIDIVLTRRPSVSGRVVSAGQPIAADVGIAYVVMGDRLRAAKVQTDEDGRFEFHLRGDYLRYGVDERFPGFKRVALQVHGGIEFEEQLIEVNAAGTNVEIEVELVPRALEEFPTVTVTDELGLPLGGAAVLSGASVLGRTGPDGRAELSDGRRDREWVLIAARGYRRREVLISELARAPIRMERATELELRLSDRALSELGEGWPTEELALVLTSTDAPFAPTQGASRAHAALALSQRLCPSGEKDGGFHTTLSFGPDGVARVEDLNPRVAFAAELRGPLGRIAGFTVDDLAPAEKRSHTIELPVGALAPGLVTGRVVDPNGDPIAFAGVSVSRPAMGLGEAFRADEQGRFRAPVMGLAPLVLCAGAKGFLANCDSHRLPQPVGRATSYAPISLDPSLTLRVDTVDSNGAPLPIKTLWRRRAGQAPARLNRNANGFEVSGTSADRVHLTAEICGSSFEAEFTVGEGYGELVVPECGTLRVRTFGAGRGVTSDLAVVQVEIWSANGEVLCGSDYLAATDVGRVALEFGPLLPGAYELRMTGRNRGVRETFALGDPKRVQVFANVAGDTEVQVPLDSVR